MNRMLTYPDGERMDEGDIVLISRGYGLAEDEGEVIQIMPRNGAAKVRVEDHHNCYRTTGNPRVTIEVLSPTCLNLLRRTM